MTGTHCKGYWQERGSVYPSVPACQFLVACESLPISAILGHSTDKVLFQPSGWQIMRACCLLHWVAGWRGRDASLTGLGVWGLTLTNFESLEGNEWWLTAKKLREWIVLCWIAAGSADSFVENFIVLR